MRTSQGSASRRPIAMVPHLGIAAALAFLLTGAHASHANPADPQFRASYLTLRAGSQSDGPSPLAIGDINGDGAPDLVLAGDNSVSPVRILLGDGAGNFAAPRVPIGVPPTSITTKGVWLADLNRDGKLDLICTGTQDTTVYVQLGHGDASFDPPIAIPTPWVVNSISVGDMNEDGIPDLVAGGKFGLSILCGDGTGRFQITYRGTSFPAYQTCLVDMDHDGHLDIVMTGNLIVLGDGHGAVAATLWGALPGYGDAVAALDLDHDGNLDVLTAFDNPDGQVAVRYGQPSIQYGSPRDTTFNLSWTPRSIVACDLDGDGRPEIITSEDRVRVFSVNAAGRLYLRTELPTPTRRNDLAVKVADLNGDGRPDIVASGYDVIAVYLTAPGGQYPAAPSRVLPGRPGALVAGKFSDGGRASAAVLLPANDALEILGAQPDGTPVYESRAGVGSGASAMAKVDLDRDGRDDLVVLDSLDAKITILRSVAGNHWTRTDVAGVPGMHWLAIGDVDQDGRDDIVTEDNVAGVLYVVRGTAAGFDAPVAVAPGGYGGNQGLLADRDGDGDPDLLLIQSGDVIALAGAPGLGFAFEHMYSGISSWYWPSAAVQADLDHDGVPDFLATGDLGFAIGHASGPWTFNNGGWHSLGSSVLDPEGARGLAVADFDGDGWDDFACALQTRPVAAAIRRSPADSFDDWSWCYGFGSTALDQCVLADLTGDGLVDLVVTDPDGQRLWIAPHVPGASTAVGSLPRSPVAGTHVVFASSAPNPTHGAATISFAQLAPGQVRLAIVDVRGRIVRRFADRAVAAGSLSVAWDGRDDNGARVGNGIYFARLEQLAPGQASVATGKLVVLP